MTLILLIAFTVIVYFAADAIVLSWDEFYIALIVFWGGAAGAHVLGMLAGPVNTLLAGHTRRLNSRVKSRAIAEKSDSRTLFAEAIRGAPQAELDTIDRAIEQSSVDWLIDVSEKDELPRFLLNSGNGIAIDYTWVRNELAGMANRWPAMAALRDYRHDENEYAKMKAFIDYCINKGLSVPSAGSQPANWRVAWQVVLYRFGMAQGDLDE